MAAHDSLGPQFYHGTNAELAPGDMVHPGHGPDKPVSSWPGHRDFTWSSTEPKEASMYGAHLYEVEPTGLHAPYKWHKGPALTAHVSLAPMKVIKKVASRG